MVTRQIEGYVRRKKSFKLRRTFMFCLSIAVSLLCLSTAYSVEYPSKPIQIVVPYPAGGAADITARILNQELSTLLGQPVVVVNKSGGGGTVGTRLLRALWKLLAFRRSELLRNGRHDSVVEISIGIYMATMSIFFFFLNCFITGHSVSARPMSTSSRPVFGTPRLQDEGGFSVIGERTNFKK